MRGRAEVAVVEFHPEIRRPWGLTMMHSCCPSLRCRLRPKVSVATLADETRLPRGRGAVLMLRLLSTLKFSPEKINAGAALLPTIVVCILCASKCIGLVQAVILFTLRNLRSVRFGSCHSFVVSCLDTHTLQHVSVVGSFAKSISIQTSPLPSVARPRPLPTLPSILSVSSRFGCKWK
jgi:hypothetical protein